MICFCNNKMDLIKINNIEYFLCPNCKYLFKNSHLTNEEEKKRYDMHVCDDDYINYMHKVYDSISGYLVDGKSLDYGCGKIHILADIFNNYQKECDYYDYYYYDKELNGIYHNIILIEVFEHIKDIYNLLIKLKDMLANNGRIIIMTKKKPDNLENWWYLRDITHVSFVEDKTMKELAKLLKMKLIIDKDLYIFIK